MKESVFIEVQLPVENETQAELLIGLLSSLEYEGIEEEAQLLKVFFKEEQFDEAALQQCLKHEPVKYSLHTITNQNWNAVWEADFEPVVLPGFCTIKADFHKDLVPNKYEIIITPKMSFGTGHHATTRLMLEFMAMIDFKDKSVFDFGTGTGILAIMAQKLGAKSVMAIDNDEWSLENAIENCNINQADKVQISLEDIETLKTPYDIILANINRNILTQYMEHLYQLLNPQGTLLLSGILEQDEPFLIDIAQQKGFSLKQTKRSNNWVALCLSK